MASASTRVDDSVTVPAELRDPETHFDYSFNVAKATQNEVQCPICFKLLADPIQTVKCGHLFCRECIIEWADTRKNGNCPTCKTALSISILEAMPTDRRAERAALSTEVKCDLCKAEMTFKKWPDHEEVCPNFHVECSFRKYGCERKVERQHLYRHENAAIQEHLNLACRKLDFAFSKLDSMNTEIERLRNELARHVNIAATPYKRTTTTASRITTFSEKFYLMGYFLRIATQITQCNTWAGLDILALQVYVWKGQYDNELAWPLSSDKIGIEVLEVESAQCLKLTKSSPSRQVNKPEFVTAGIPMLIVNFDFNDVKEEARIQITVKWKE